MTEHVTFLDRCRDCGRVTDLSSALVHHCPATDYATYNEGN